MTLTPDFVSSDGMRVLITSALHTRHRERRRGYETMYREANPDKLKANQARYNQTDKAKECRRRYNQTDKAKECRRRYAEAYPERLEEIQRKYNQTDKAKARQSRWYELHREERLAKDKIRYKQNYEKYRTTRRKYAVEHRETIGQQSLVRHHKRYRNDPIYHLVCACRSRLKKVLKRRAISARFKKVLGCTYEELKRHIEAQFKPGMTWDNYGFYGWHIDHIQPIASFDLTNPDELVECFSYRNLQPLWWGENLRKSDRMEDAVNN